MSHFSVLVIGEDVEGQLAPYHEFECTGLVDEYVQTIDQTEELRITYETETRFMVRLSDGAYLSLDDSSLYREPTEKERAMIGPFGGTGGGHGLQWLSREWEDGTYSPRIFDITLLPGAEEVEVLHSEVSTFEEYLVYVKGKVKGEVFFTRPGEVPDLEGDHKYGWAEVDEKGSIIRVVRRTNPNAKWDWYTIGGRWENYFPMKSGGGASQGRWKDVDYDRAKAEAEAKARKDYAEWGQALAGRSKPRPWAFYCEQVDAHLLTDNEARERYNAQEAIAAYSNPGFECPVKRFGFDEEAYVDQRRAGALVPFALLRNGNWTERATMGWFGLTRNEKDLKEWQDGVAALLSDLPPDTLVTIVDCHI